MLFGPSHCSHPNSPIRLRPSHFPHSLPLMIFHPSHSMRSHLLSSIPFNPCSSALPPFPFPLSPSAHPISSIPFGPSCPFRPSTSLFTSLSPTKSPIHAHLSTATNFLYTLISPHIFDQIIYVLPYRNFASHLLLSTSPFHSVINGDGQSCGQWTSNFVCVKL